MLRADWLAGCRGDYIKGVATSDRLHLWGVAQEDDVTDWEPDK